MQPSLPVDIVDKGLTVFVGVVLFLLIALIVFLVALNNFVHGFLQKNKAKRQDALPYLITSSSIIFAIIAFWVLMGRLH